VTTLETDFDALGPWRLSPEVSLRDESFGALAYHHVNRRLVFLKSPSLVVLVSRLDQYRCADDALVELVDEPSRESHRRALGSLANSGIIRGG
jgi:putative mycofactocin binding protein MftB